MSVTKEDYEPYRQAQIESARVFQDFVVDACLNILKMPICAYSSRLYQYEIGESAGGVEIKHDKKFAATGNLYVETSEKARPRPGDFAKSGIYRADNTWLYIIGDYDTLFVFPKKLLIGLHQSKRYREVENETATSTGFLLPGNDGKKYAAIVLTPNASSKVSKSVFALDQLSASLFKSMIENEGNQMLLNF